MEEACHYDENHPTEELYHEDEVIDTLSLSDLQIYDNNGNPQNSYDQNPNDDDADDQFEFSSELLKTSVSNSIVFCGKIIPYKETSPACHVSKNTHKLLKSKKQRWRRFVWYFKKSAKANIDSEKLVDLKYDHEVPNPISKVSILASATSKSRWYLLMFGFGSSRLIPGEMHIRDLKKRQISMGTKKGGGANKKSGGAIIGSWRLLKVLGCGGGSYC